MSRDEFFFFSSATIRIGSIFQSTFSPFLDEKKGEKTSFSLLSQPKKKISLGEKGANNVCPFIQGGENASTFKALLPLRALQREEGKGLHRRKEPLQFAQEPPVVDVRAIEGRKMRQIHSSSFLHKDDFSPPIRRAFLAEIDGFPFLR